MKKILLTLLAGGAFAAPAQDVVPIEKAREIARIITQQAGELSDAPFRMVLDLERPQVLAKEKRGGIVIPVKGLDVDAIAKAGDKAVPVGMLWLRNLLPGTGAIAAADDSGIRRAELTADGKRVTIHPFFVGVQKGQRGLDLVLYGKSSKEPYLKTRLRPLPSRQEFPVELAAYAGDDTGATLMLSIGGKYQAEVTIVPHDTEEHAAAVEHSSGKAVEAAHMLKQHLNDFQAGHVRIAGDPNKADFFEKSGVAVLIIPDQHLSAESLAKVGKKEIPMGQMWMKDLVPEVDGRVPAAVDLKRVSLSAKGEEHHLPQFLLTAQRSGDKLIMSVYSGAKEPLLTVPLEKFEAGSSLPIELEGESRDDASGLLSLHVLGKYRAKLIVRPD